MNKESLRNFLLQTSTAGYGSENPTSWEHEDDGSTTIVYESGDWRMNDNFFGGEPYGGREVIFYKNKPYWLMVYYGFVDSIVDHNTIYNFLKEVLRNAPIDLPLRGPEEYPQKNGPLLYTSTITGDIERFEGEENISQNEKNVYKATFSGGIIDQR